MADPPKSLGGRLKEGLMDFCERMADVEAGRRNQYGGMPQQMHDAEDERRRLRKEAQKAKEQGHQNNSNDDVGGDEHRENKDADKVDERRKKDDATTDPGVQSDKTTKQNPKHQKNKPVDKGAAHETGKHQNRLQGHEKLALTSGKTLTVPEGGFQQMSESSSDEELQWITDRMMLGDLDEVPVGLGHSKTEMPKSSNMIEEPPLRLRGGGGGGNRYRFREYDDDNDEDYHNALREAARNKVKDRSQQKEKHVHFGDAKHAEEPRYPPFSNNPRAGPSTNHGFGRGARTSAFAGQSSHSGSQGLGFDQSSGKNKGNRGAGLGFSGGVNFGESSSSKNSGKRGAGVRTFIVESSDDESSDSGRQSHGKDKNGNRGGRRTPSPSSRHGSRQNKSGRRPRSPSLSPSPTRAQNHERHRGTSGKRTSKDSESSFDEEGSSDLENAVGHMPPDYYGILDLTPDCSVQEYVDNP